MDGEQKVFSVGLVSMAVALIVLSIAGKGCNESDNVVKKAAVEHNCTWLGDGKFACPQNQGEKHE